MTAMELHSLLDDVVHAGAATVVEVFTGAGMSADSGLATYRDEETGVWEHVDPTAMASIDAWEEEPEPMWAWYLWRTRLSHEAEPNAGHRAIGRWAATPGFDVHVTTQNIDGLHERGGVPAERVAHLHGSLHEFRCDRCGAPVPEGDVGELPVEPVARLSPPGCTRCSGRVRPGVVWFGEPLPPDTWQVAERRMLRADLVVIVGTSGVVFPAASLPVVAKRAGAAVIEVSPQPTELTRLADVFLGESAARGVPKIIDAAIGRMSQLQ